MSPEELDHIRASGDGMPEPPESALLSVGPMQPTGEPPQDRQIRRHAGSRLTVEGLRAQLEGLVQRELEGLTQAGERVRTIVALAREQGRMEVPRASREKIAEVRRHVVAANALLATRGGPPVSGLELLDSLADAAGALLQELER